MMTTNNHTNLGLSDQDVLDMYRYMLLTRKLDERMWLLNRAGKINFVVSGQGQEAAQVGAAFALDKTTDFIAPYYRDMGLVLYYGMSIKELLLSSFAKEEDPNSGGRQMPGHYGQRKNKIITGSSPVTTQLPHAVGFAFAAKLKKQDFVTLTTLGDGSTNQGDFHEGLNFAGIHNLPVITLVQNNKYAISVPLNKQIGSENIAIRGKAYGIPGYVIDGNDPLQVYNAVKQARERALNGDGPTLIEAVTDRLTAHSSDDNDAVYRTKEEIEKMKGQDCLIRFKTYLQESKILTAEIDQTITEQIDQEINEATEYAEQAPYASPDTLTDFVYDQQGGNTHG